MRKFTGTHLPDELAERLLAVADDLQAGRVGEQDMGPVVDVVCELCDTVMAHFFQQPARDFGLSRTLRTMVDVSISSAERTVHFGLRKVLPKLDDQQRRQLGEFLRASIYEFDDDRR